MKGITEEKLLEFDPWLYDNQQDLLNAILEQCTELNQWQPIESAPKDRELWLYYHSKLMCMGMFNTISYGFKPTHWQELPEDPK